MSTVPLVMTRIRFVCQQHDLVHTIVLRQRCLSCYQISKHHTQLNRLVTGITGLYNVHSRSNKATTAQYHVDRLKFKNRSSLFVTYKRLGNFNEMFPFYILTNQVSKNLGLKGN
uniref:Uncharacterized protein n=1 Tax=Hyaloperonospora arabidopsidis (strain Emoy2) TaxID=559515 RepID=M4C3S7_HYAAE